MAPKAHMTGIDNELPGIPVRRIKETVTTVMLKISRVFIIFFTLF